MVLALPPPRKIILWTPALVQTLLAIIGTVLVSVVALGQWQLAKQKSWREAAEGSAALVESLKEQLEHTRDEMQAHLDNARKDRELLTVQIQALQGQLSLVQRDHEEDRNRTEGQMARLMRLNHRLQLELDASESRTVKQTRQLQERLPDLPDRDDVTDWPLDPEEE